MSEGRLDLLRLSSHLAIGLGIDFRNEFRCTLLSRLPFAIFASFLIVLCRYTGATYVMWWESDENGKKMAKIASQFWKERTSEEEKKILVSGTEVFQKVLMVLIHMIKMANRNSTDDLMLTYDVEAVKKVLVTARKLCTIAIALRTRRLTIGPKKK